MSNAPATDKEQNAPVPVFHIQRIYMKDMSFETPKSPHIFQSDWKPEINMEVNSDHTVLSQNAYEVVLRLTITAKLHDEVAFLCEVEQGGIFTIEGISQEGMPSTLGAYCPNILYPYAREAVTSLVTRGSFPQLNLGPINFDALFAAKQKKAEQAQSEQAEQAAQA